MDNKEIPELLKNRYDIKFNLISYIDRAVQVLGANEIEGVTFPTNVKTVFITNFGLIEGTIVDIQEKVRDIKYPIRLIVQKALELRNKELSEIENARLVNETSFFLLSDVMITPFSFPDKKSSISEMVLFADQVVGVSAGERIEK